LQINTVIPIFELLFLILMKRLFFLLCTLLAFSCTERVPLETGNDSIVVLFENDVHCAIDGYKHLAGYRDAVKDTANAAVVSCGDYLQGGTAGAISEGDYIVRLLRSVGYDALTLGNHEFDYGVPRLKDLFRDFNAPVVCCNLFDMDGRRLYDPYVICTYGKRRIAYVGVTTPEAQYTDEVYSFYDGDGNQLYDTRRDSYKQLVQEAVDSARGEGADYVILLSHMGETVTSTSFTSVDLIASTSGIDAVLDAHSHSVVNTTVTNREGKEVLLCQTGTGFANIGKLVIGKDGALSVSFISSEEFSAYDNASVAVATSEVEAKLDVLTGRVVMYADVPILITDGEGTRLVRKQETNAADLVTDAMRGSVSAQIALISGGSLRKDIPAGEVKYRQVIDMLPFEDYVWKIDASGRQILRALELGVGELPEENGNFVQVSGIKYTASVSGHSISDVQVLQDDGTYAPIQPDGSYSVAVLDYFLTGGGLYDVFAGCPLLESTNDLSRDVVIQYVSDVLGGRVGAPYDQPQGRITIVD